MRVITDTGELPSLDTIILQGRGELNLYNQTLRFKPGKDYTHPDFNIPIYNPSTQTYDFTWVNRGPYVALVSPRDGSVGTPVWSSIGLEYIDKTLATAGDVITFDGLNVVWSPGGGGGGGGVTSVSLNMPSAFTVVGSPITTAGTFIVSGAGTSSQYIDGTGALQTFPSGTGLLTANNGLTENPATNVQLGGLLLQNTTINADTYLFDVIGTNNSVVFQVKNTSVTGTGVAAYFESASDNAITAQSLSGKAAIFGFTNGSNYSILGLTKANGNNVVTLVKTARIINSGSVGVGLGGAIDISLPISSSAVIPTSTIEMRALWTSVSPLDASWQLWTTTANSLTQKMEVFATGQLKIDRYGIGTFLGTPAYSLGVDATGNVVEFTPATGGGGIKSGTASGTNNYTVTISGVSSYTDGDTYVIKFTNGNDDDSSININGLGAKNLEKQANIRVTGGDIVSGQELIIIYDGTHFQTLGVAPNQLFAYVTNDDSVTITKGQPVYAFGAAGNRMSVKLANNTSDSTSAQTVGVVFSSSIAPNQKGFIITQGVISGVNTSAYSPGAQLYLGATAGTLTATKPYAPNHLVYIGIVERANAGNGQIYVKPQNGYELNELHDVDLITSAPVNNDLLTYVSGSPNLWKNRSLGAILGGTTSQYVRGDGTLATTPTGTVTGVTATSPITSSGGTAPVISTSMATNRLIGRSTAGTGVMEEIQVGNFLTLSSGVLSSVPPIELSQVYTTAWNLAPTIILAAASGGTSTSANQWYIIPKYLPPNTSISDIGVRISTLSSSLTGRLAIYTSTYDSTNKGFIPNSRVANSGALTISGTGFVSFTLPSTIQVSGWVFFVVGFTATTCTFRNVNSNSVIGLPALVNSGSPLNTDTTVRNGMYTNTSNARTSDPPNPWTGALSQVNSNIPAIFFFIP
jgi:hypothetical protein